MARKINIEERSKKFQERLNEITKITYTFMNAWYMPIKAYEFIIKDNGVFRTQTFDDGLPCIMSKEPDGEYMMSKNEFIEKLGRFNIGAWTKFSPPADVFILDGVKWELEVKYGKGVKKFTTSGENAYPSNFKAVMRFLGIK